MNSPCLVVAVSDCQRPCASLVIWSTFLSSRLCVRGGGGGGGRLGSQFHVVDTHRHRSFPRSEVYSGRELPCPFRYAEKANKQPALGTRKREEVLPVSTASHLGPLPGLEPGWDFKTGTRNHLASWPTAAHG